MGGASRIESTRSALRVSTGALLFVTLCACSSTDPNASAPAGVNSAPSTPAVAAGVSGSTATAATQAASGSAGAAKAATSGAAGTNGPNTSKGLNGAAGKVGTGVTGDVTNPGAAGQVGSGTSMMSVAGSGGASTGAAGAMMSAAGSGASTAADGCKVAPITADMRSRYENMDEPYYTKYASANGIIVATGDKVVDEAVVRYCQLLSEMISNDKVRKAMLDDKMWFTMIGEEEQLSSLPQIDRAYGTSLNQRARGLGGLTPTICAEDSIMCLPGDRWDGDCICPHETGHTLYSSGIRPVAELSDRLTAITNAARQSGRLSNAYVWMDGNESGMMAWGVQAWYNCAIDGMMGGYHSDINTRDELQKELPEFYEFLSELLPKDNKYEDCYAK